MKKSSHSAAFLTVNFSIHLRCITTLLNIVTDKSVLLIAFVIFLLIVWCKLFVVNVITTFFVFCKTCLVNRYS